MRAERESQTPELRFTGREEEKAMNSISSVFAGHEQEAMQLLIKAHSSMEPTAFYIFCQDELDAIKSRKKNFSPHDFTSFKQALEVISLRHHLSSSAISPHDPNRGPTIPDTAKKPDLDKLI